MQQPLPVLFFDQPFSDLFLDLDSPSIEHSAVELQRPFHTLFGAGQSRFRNGRSNGWWVDHRLGRKLELSPPARVCPCEVERA